ISPWNYPFSIPFSEVIMALLAGNAVVLKVASETQLVGKALEACIGAAGLPSGLFAYVNLPGKQAGSALLEAGVNKLFFTGSVAVGQQLMAEASRTLTPLSLELGGNDAMLVCEDADLDRAAAGALWAGMQNAGQSCGRVERIYVHEAVYEEFLRLLKERVEALRVGHDRDFEVDVGAMTTRRQLETVGRHVQDALGKGAVLYASSKSPEDSNGLFLPAMVVTNVDHGMLLMRERDLRAGGGCHEGQGHGRGRRAGQRLEPRHHGLRSVPRFIQGRCPGSPNPGGGGHGQRPPDEPRACRNSLGRLQAVESGSDPRSHRIRRDDPTPSDRSRLPARGEEGHLVAPPRPPGIRGAFGNPGCAVCHESRPPLEGPRENPRA